MRTVVIVLLDPACNAQLGLIEVLVFVEPHLLFFQTAMEPLDIAVALGVIVGRAPVRNTQPVQRLNVPAEVNCVPLSVVNVKPMPQDPKGKAPKTARFSAARASSLRQRSLKSQPTISRVQQSMTETRYAQPTFGPAQTFVMSDCHT